ncbi:MAG TPA: hypothetical protein VGO18_22820 [Steroidobacteraceae bacterium]|nr:hypothetical protein [Steroidobacteraceae bacterium]
MRTWRFVDADHLTQDWRIEGSPKGNSTVHLDFVRKDQARCHVNSDACAKMTRSRTQ